jgi:hypothetical protein
MHRPTHIPLNPLEFPLTLAGGLRRTFADVVSAPLPERLATLLRRLSADEWVRRGARSWGKHYRNAEPC